MTAGKLFEGSINRWVDRSQESGFGWIRYDSGRPRLQDIFYLHTGIAPDNVGRRSHGKIAGNLVRFRLEKHIHRGSPAVKAVDIVSVFPTDVAEPDAHREITVVESLVRNHRGFLGSIFLRRKCGDQLHLSRADVSDDYKERFLNLHIGDHVWCGVQPSTNSRHPTWCAVAAEFYSAEEEHAMREEGV